MNQPDHTRLTSPQQSSPPSTSPPRDSAPDAPAVRAEPAALPERIGRYRVVRLLGEGGFGQVFQANDDELGRAVAIKVPHRHRIARPEQIEAYLAEARILASLDHSHIVPVHDVGRTEDGLCFVVSKFIEGSDLAKRLRHARLSFAESAGLVAAVAEALHHAHRKGLVHRDIKPANLLLDVAGKPYVADFGLALREADFGKGAQYAGTPAYMSPEQARGEGHRVDGRSDVFSLGVVFYELLTGRRPFKADTTNELLEQIAGVEVRPPRQVDEAIPKELERICLKALAKRASDRYTTAKDLGDDLRFFLAHAADDKGATDPAVVAVAAAPTPVATPVPTPPSDQRPVKVVPKGLRSFDASDADFFLELLPGPRDRDGLPESIRFWKGRIEETDPDNTFPVGLLYGPSGCGKSSLMKAGLLPRLAGHVLAVYVEATAEETEARLLRGLRKSCPDLPAAGGLVEALSALRRGHGLPAGKKVLIVLDQFEQWLHGERGVSTPRFDIPELAHALRQCDGGRLQCVVMVRDDFWMAATRFMQALEVRLVEGHNSAAADLFDSRHARKVLAAFGQALAALPERAGEWSQEQETFLEQAVAGLSQDGKVVSVRLALFAEMVKGKPWTPATLKAVGGTEGVGVTFLEETFAATTAPPQHRLHRRAAQAVLKALLPETGTAIKGNMRSRGELLEASGYASRPGDFEELLYILDAELRLITPTDPEAIEAAREEPLTPDPSPPRGEGRYYQLTHDYLVPALREWLTRKQKETRRGRAELRLAERAAQWNLKREGRHLPAWWEYLNIRLFTRKKQWTPPQRQMMRKAGRYHAVRGAALAVLLTLLGVAGLAVSSRITERNRATHAAGLVDRLLDAETAQIPAIVAELEGYRTWTDPLLKEAFDQADEGSRQKLHASLGLLPADPGQLEYLYGRLLDAQPETIVVIRDALLGHREDLAGRLWGVLKPPAKGREGPLLCAAAGLAVYAPDDPRWKQANGDVAELLAGVNPFFVKYWMDALRPVRGKLVAPLSGIFHDAESRGFDRLWVANILADYAADRPEVLADLLMGADEKSFAVLFPVFQKLGERGAKEMLAELEKQPRPAWDAPVTDPAWENIDAAAQAARERLAKRQANAAVALLRMGRPEEVWPLLKHKPDPRVRSYLIHCLSPLGADPRTIIQRLEAASRGRQPPEVTIRRALLLCLGEFGEEELPAAQRQALLPRLLALYRDDPDPGIHSAAAWLLRQWGHNDRLKEIDQEMVKRDREPASRGRQPPEGRRWYVNGQGQTFVIVPGPVEFWMGSPPTEARREGGAEGRIETRHWRRIGRSFALASHEVTVEQFLRFRKDHAYNKSFSPTTGHPVNIVSWYDAADYCNWLSEQEGIPEEQWCYLPVLKDGKEVYAEGMRAKPNYLGLTGYRLPTEAEWEHACRAGALTARYYGETEDLLGRYAWYRKNSLDRGMLTPGSLKPNDLGLFDAQGNAREWCQDIPRLYTLGSPDKPFVDIEDKEDIKSISDRIIRVLRGSSFSCPPHNVRSADRSRVRPANSYGNYGFRPARTIR